MASWLREHIFVAYICLTFANTDVHYFDKPAKFGTLNHEHYHSDQSEVHKLLRMKKALSFEASAVAYLERYTRRKIRRSGNSFSLALEKEFLPLNTSERKPWVNKEKMVRHCDVDAYEMTQVDPSGFCEIAKTDCRSSGTLNYLELPFCILPNQTWIAVLFMIFWLMVLVLWLSTTVDYICPNLVMITHVLGIRDSVAGITFLGEGSPSRNYQHHIAFTRFFLLTSR